MRAIVFASALSLLCNPAQALESLWVSLEAHRILEPLCSNEVRGALGEVSIASLEEPTRVIRRRETEFTARVKTGGDLQEAEAAMAAYSESMGRQLRDAVKQLGCARAVSRFRLQADKPLSLALITKAAHEMPLPSSERTNAIPDADRTGTEAAYPLQLILMSAATKEKTCDRSSVKVTPISKKMIEASNAPPFVGTPMFFEERWDMLCDGKPTSFIMKFRQDARTWRGYGVEPGT